MQMSHISVLGWILVLVMLYHQVLLTEYSLFISYFGSHSVG